MGKASEIESILRHLFDMDTSIYILCGVKCIENEIDSNLTCEYRDNKKFDCTNQATYVAKGSKSEDFSQASEFALLNYETCFQRSHLSPLIMK